MQLCDYPSHGQLERMRWSLVGGYLSLYSSVTQVSALTEFFSVPALAQSWSADQWLVSFCVCGSNAAPKLQTGCSTAISVTTGCVALRLEL